MVHITIVFMGFIVDKPIYIIWVSFITTEPCSPEPWNHGFYREIIPSHGQTIQLSEIL